MTTTDQAVWGEQLTARMRALRDDYVDLGADRLAIAIDDLLEDHGMHADERRTCWTCQEIVTDGHTHGYR